MKGVFDNDDKTNFLEGGFASGKRRSSLDGLTDGEIKVRLLNLTHLIHFDQLSPLF